VPNATKRSIGISGSLQRPGGPNRGETMPGIDARSGVSNRGQLPSWYGSSDSRTKRSRNRLEAFIVPSCTRGSTDLRLYAPDPAAVVQALRANRLLRWRHARGQTSLSPRPSGPGARLYAGSRVPQSDAWSRSRPPAPRPRPPPVRQRRSKHTQPRMLPTQRSDRPAPHGPHGRRTRPGRAGPGCRTWRKRPVPRLRWTLPEPWLLSDPIVVNEPTI